MTLPLGRFVHTDLDPGTSAALAAARVAAFVDLRDQLWTWDAFKVRYVRTPAGAKRYGVPIGSPIPVGRKVKVKSGGPNSSGGSGSGSRSTPNRVQMSPAERTVAQRAFGGDNDNGARINERGELEITDNERAKKRLDATANNPNTSAADKKAAQDLHRRIDVLPPADDEDGGDEAPAPKQDAPKPKPEPEPAPVAPPAPEPAAPEPAPAAPTPAAPPQVVELEDADRPIIDQAFGGDEDHGARLDDDGNLEVTDPDRATERLTELLTGDAAGDISDADWSRIESIQDDLAELERPNAPGMTPNELTDDYASKVDLSQAQKDAVASYTGAGYHGINARLRGQDYSTAAVNDPAELQRQTDLINDAMGRYTTPDTITAHRSIYGESGFPDGDITGQVITSPGFSSTAVGRPAPGFGNGENHLEITIPKGSHGIDVGGSGAGSFGGDEREFILPNSTRFRVDAVEYRMKDGERQRVLKVTALPPADTGEALAASAARSLPIGRFIARSWLAVFKVRYVRTPAGARRYGVPIGSPIPIGRRVKPTSGGGSGGGGGAAASPKPRRVSVPPAQRPAARRNFWGSDDNGASWDDDRNELDVHDPDRARAALDEALKDPSLDADQRRNTRGLRDSIGDDRPEAAPEPDAPAADAPDTDGPDSPDAAGPQTHPLPPAERGVARRHFWTNDGANGATWDDDTNELHVTDPDLAAAALDRTLADSSIDDDVREVTQELRDRIAPANRPNGNTPGDGPDTPEPPATAEPDMSPDRLTADYYRRMQESKVATIPQKRAVSDYTGPGYSEINGHLRNPNPRADQRWNDYMNSRTQPIDELFDQYQTPAPTTVHRYVSAQGIPDGAAPGRVVTLAGYTSTSMADTPPPGFEDRDAVLTIRVPKGMPAVIPDGLGVGKPNEREMLLPHNTRFRVESVTQKDGKTWIEMTALPPLPAETP